MDDTLEKPKVREDRPASHDPVASTYRELWPAFAAWARHTFSVASLISGLKSLVWVAPLSVMIWIYADRQLTPAPLTVSIPIIPRSPDSTRIVRLVEPEGGKVRADLDGPNGLLQPVLKQLESGATVAEFDVPENALQTPGNHRIDSSLLNDLPLFTNNSITVQNIEPTDLVINVDVLQSVQVDVQPAAEGENFVSPPTFEPRKVTVRAPGSVIKPGMVVYAHLTEAKEAKGALAPGSQDLTGIPLSLSTGDDPNVTIAPAFVSAHVEIKKSDVTGTIPSIPIWATYPPGVDDKYKATYDNTLSNVTVTGPEDLVRPLAAGTSQQSPRATFEVDARATSTDVDHTATLNFELPAGVHVSPEFAQKTITYRLIERRSGD
jgi:hypothetical protein